MNHHPSLGASPSYVMSTKNGNEQLPSVAPDDNEADVLNDETFGDCDLDTIKIKSDFGENGEFLGDHLPDFFNADGMDPTSLEGLSLTDQDDQSQQPSIDALLGEDPMRVSIGLRPTTNPLFTMAISQARESTPSNLFSQPAPMPRLSPMTVQQAPINMAMLKQYEQMLINQQIPPQERMVHLQALIERMQRTATPPSRVNVRICLLFIIDFVFLLI